MKTCTTTNSSRIEPSSGRQPFLTAFAIVLTLAASSIATQADILAHWTFDELSGSIAHDSAGSFNGTLSPNGAAFVPSGKSGGAIRLERNLASENLGIYSKNGYVYMGNVLDLTSGDFSIVAWVKMSAGDQTSETVVLSKHERWYNNGYIIGINSLGGGGQADKAMFYEGTVAGAPVSTTSVNDGNWHQIVAVYHSGGSKSIYVDGAPAESTQASEPFIGNLASFMIGGTSDNNGVKQGGYSGLIDDVQIYNNALSDPDVHFLFQHPGQIVLDCSQKLAAVQAELAAANAANAALQAQLTTCSNTLATANETIQDLQSDILDLLLPIHLLTQEFRMTFNDPHFRIRGVTAVDQMQNLVAEILDLPRGQQQQLFIGLGGHKGKGKLVDPRDRPHR